MIAIFISYWGQNFFLMWGGSEKKDSKLVKICYCKNGSLVFNHDEKVQSKMSNGFFVLLELQTYQ